MNTQHIAAEKAQAEQELGELLNSLLVQPLQTHTTAALDEAIGPCEVMLRGVAKTLEGQSAIANRTKRELEDHKQQFQLFQEAFEGELQELPRHMAQSHATELKKLHDALDRFQNDSLQRLDALTALNQAQTQRQDTAQGDLITLLVEGFQTLQAQKDALVTSTQQHQRDLNTQLHSALDRFQDDTRHRLDALDALTQAQIQRQDTAQGDLNKQLEQGFQALQAQKDALMASTQQHQRDLSTRMAEALEQASSHRARRLESMLATLFGKSAKSLEERLTQQDRNLSDLTQSQAQADKEERAVVLRTLEQLALQLKQCEAQLSEQHIQQAHLKSSLQRLFWAGGAVAFAALSIAGFMLYRLLSLAPLAP